MANRNCNCIQIREQGARVRKILKKRIGSGIRSAPFLMFPLEPSGKVGDRVLCLVAETLLMATLLHALAALVLGNFRFASFFERAHSGFQIREPGFNHLIRPVATYFFVASLGILARAGRSWSVPTDGEPTSNSSTCVQNSLFSRRFRSSLHGINKGGCRKRKIGQMER